MCPSVSKRSRTPFRICLDQETAQVLNTGKYLMHLLMPPIGHVFIQWICSIQFSQFHRGSIVQAHVKLDTIFPEDFSHVIQLAKVFFCNHISSHLFHIHIIDDHCIDANRCRKSCVHSCSLIHHHFVFRKKEGISGIAAFDASIHIVPMVQHS